MCYFILPPRSQRMGEEELEHIFPTSLLDFPWVCMQHWPALQPQRLRAAFPLGGVYLGFTLNHSEWAVAGSGIIGDQGESPLLFSTLGEEAPWRSCPHCGQLPAKGLPWGQCACGD